MPLTDFADDDMAAENDWPAEADFIFCTLETTPFWGAPCFLQGAVPYHVHAIFESAGHDDAHILYIRNITARGLSFIAPRQLPPSCKGELRLASPDGTPRKIACVSLQCRQAALGWVEGTISFNRPEPGLVPGPASVQAAVTAQGI